MIEEWLERPGALASEALLGLLDPGLEHGEDFPRLTPCYIV